MASPLPLAERQRRHALYTEAYAAGDAALIRAIYPELKSTTGWLAFSNWCCQQGLATPKQYRRSNDCKEGRMTIKRNAAPRKAPTTVRRKSTRESELAACEALPADASYPEIERTCKKFGASIRRVMSYRASPNGVARLREALTKAQ